MILSSFVVSCGDNVLKDNSKSESLKISLMNVIKKLEQDIQSQAKMIIEAVEYINMSLCFKTIDLLRNQLGESYNRFIFERVSTQVTSSLLNYTSLLDKVDFHPATVLGKPLHK